MDLATVCSFSESDVRLLEQVRRQIAQIQTITMTRNGYENDPGLTAHIVCQALARMTELEYSEGLYCGRPHFWLKTPTGNIIDPLPVCMYGPVLLSSRCEPTHTMYKPKKLYMQGIHNKGLVDQVERALLSL